MTAFVVVPQWQGSGSSRAMRLIDGAEAIRGDLPASATRVVEVPLEAGDEQGSGISRLSSLQLVRERTTETIARLEGTVIAIGGDCGIEWAAVERFAGDDVALVWFDAHPDLNTPASSPSGAFHGMVLRTLIDEGFPAERVVLAGARSFDDEEERFLADSGPALLEIADLGTPDALLAAIEATGAESVYVHIDLDVLDPAGFQGLVYPEPFGLEPGTLVQLLHAVRARWPLVGAGITEFAPSSPDAAAEDMPTILRIIGALTA